MNYQKNYQSKTTTTIQINRGEKMKNALKLAAVINIIIALISLNILKTITYPFIISILSLIYFVYCGKTIKYIYNNKTIIIILALINFFLNPISGIILLIGQDKLAIESKNSKETEEEHTLTKEEKQTSILLNLGVALIILSGIILITTKWNVITPIIKLAILAFFAVLFLILSNISNKKLKIELLEKKYWLLSMLFIILTVIANGYFKTFSDWFSYTGLGKNLYIAFTSIIISLLAEITQKKYEKNIYKNISYIGIVTSISFILLQINIKIEIVLIILSVLFLLGNLLLKTTEEKELCKYLTIIISVFNITMFTSSTMIIPQIILSLLTILNIAYIGTKNNKQEEIISAILINITILSTVLNISYIKELQSDITTIILLTIYSIIYILNLIKTEKNNTIRTLSNIITNIVFSVLLIENIENRIILTIVAATITSTSIINYYKNTIKYENILLPIKIAILLISIILLIKELIEPIYAIIPLYILAFTIYKLIKNKNIKTLSLIIYYIIFTLSLILNNNKEIIPSVINIIAASTTLLLINKEQNKINTKISYITLLITIASTLVYTNILNTTTLINSTLILMIYLLLTLTTLKEQNTNKINYLSIILPLVIMINDTNIAYEIEAIVMSTIEIYILMLLNTFLLKKDKDRNILIAIIIPIIILRIIMLESWIIGLYIGIIALLLIITGYIKENYKTLYIEGIIITILNILIQFQYIIKELPLWLYMLLAGLTIIGLVTFKITKNQNQGNNEN